MAKHLQGQAKTDGKQTEVGIMVQDTLLPVPEDLAKLKAIDASIVGWMMQHADKEQAARIKAQEAYIKFDSERVALTKSEHGIVKTSLWLAFAIAFLAMLLSGVFIYFGYGVAGTIFGGATLVVCVQSFLKFGRNQKQ